MTNILHICANSERRRQAMCDYRAVLGDLAIYNTARGTVRTPDARCIIHLVVLTDRGDDEIGRIRGCAFSHVIGDFPRRHAALIAALARPS